MSSFILHAYPVWDTLNTLGQDTSNVETQKQLSHWLTFWMMSFSISNLPIPDMIQWIMITSLYFPFTTEKVRTILLQYMPFVEKKAGEGFDNLKRMVAEKLSNMNGQTSGYRLGNGESDSHSEKGMLSKVGGFLTNYF